MVLTENFWYKGQAMPSGTVVPPHLNKFIDVERISVRADTANIRAGMLVNLTATTHANDMTECGANFGSADTEGILCVVDVVEHDLGFATTLETPEFPNRIPNISATAADYNQAANGSLIVVPIQLGMVFWALGSSDGTFDAVLGMLYKPAANGLVAALPTAGTAIDVRSWVFRALASTSNQNWLIIQTMGLVAYDAS